jgi:hypothetical protein
MKTLNFIKCGTCKIVKHESEFYKNAARTTKHAHKCKLCEQKYKRDRTQSLKRNRVIIKNKVCSECCIKKDISHFNRLNRNTDGYNGKCRQCEKAYVLKWKTSKFFLAFYKAPRTLDVLYKFLHIHLVCH